VRCDTFAVCGTPDVADNTIFSEEDCVTAAICEDSSRKGLTPVELFTEQSSGEEIACELLPGVECDTVSAGGLDQPAEGVTCGWRTVSMVESPVVENRMFVPIVLDGGREVRGMIDTGASRSMIGKKIVNELGWRVTSSNELYIKGFGTDNRCAIAGVTTFRSSLHGLRMLPLEVYVIDNNAQTEDFLILGTDFLLSNGLTVNLSRNRVSKQLSDGTRWEYYPPLNGDAHCFTNVADILCCAAVDVRVNPGETACFHVEWSPECSQVMGCVGKCCEEQIYLLSNLKEESKFRVISGLIAGSESSQTVLVCNDGDTPVKISQGDAVCLASTAVDPRRLGMNYDEAEVFVGEVRENEFIEMGDVMIGPNLTKQQRASVWQLLKGERQLFSGENDEIGTLSCTEHRIELYDYTPIYQRPRRFPEPVEKDIAQQCTKLNLMDIIEPSSSPWSSPVVPIRKKDNTLRLCIDYRRLNAVTKADKWPLPNLNDAVFGLHGMNYFTSLDLTKSYYQLPLEKNSREMTAFSTAHGHWQFKRLSFGLKNAPAAFQREMQKVLSQFPWRRVIVYIDDILILSETFEGHLELVSKVMQTLAAHGCRVNLQKCQFFCTEVEFLGHIVSSRGLSKPPSYTNAISNYKKPTTVGELREFLGLVNFQRKFVPDCSLIMKPLSRLTGAKKNTKLDWNPELDDAFEKLKRELVRDVILAFPDYSADANPLELYTDASGVGVGSVLTQIQGGVSRPIAYISRAFNSAQRNYNTLERELAAIRWSIKTFRAFLLGVHFVVHTDHQPLVYLHNMQIVNARLARTLEDLAEFDFVIKYTPGKTNTAADALSRIHPDTSACASSLACDMLVGDLPCGLYVTKTIPGGGDSMCHSLHVAGSQAGIANFPPDPLELRVALAMELLRAPEKYGLKVSKQLRQELRAMQGSGRLMCNEALLAFSYLYSCTVLVHYGGSVPVIYDTRKVVKFADDQRIHLQCLANVHYNPVVESKDYTLQTNKQVKFDDTNMQQVISKDSINYESQQVELAVSCSMTCCSSDQPMGPYGWCEKHSHTHVASVMLNIGGQRCCALIDTGAQISCMLAEIFCKSDGELDNFNNLMIRGLGPNCCPVYGSAEVDFTMFETVLSQRFAVVAAGTMPFCVILGADFIHKSGLQLDFEMLTCSAYNTTLELALPWAVAPNVGYLLRVEPLARELPETVTEVCIGNPENQLTFGICSPEDEDSINITNIIDYEQMLLLQRKDRTLTQLRRHIMSGAADWPKSLRRFKRYAANIAIVNKLIVYTDNDQKQLCVVTFSVLVEIMLVVHYKMAHPGRQKLLAMVRDHVWHPSASAVAADVTRCCDACQRVKVAPTIQPPVIKIQTSSPFELVAVDLVALPTTSRGRVCCLVLIDHNSKWLSVAPLTAKKAHIVTAALEHRILPYLPKLPLKILSDNGAEFTSSLFNRVLDDYGIDHKYTTPRKPSSNGLVERVNRTLIELLRNMNSSADSWDSQISKAVVIYNTTYHVELQMSPSQYLLSKNHSTVSEPVLSSADTESWREGNPAFVPYKIGQKVLRKVVYQGRQLADKLRDRFEGPFVVRVINPNKVTYIVEWCDGSNKEIRAHHSQLKKYHEPPRYLANHSYYVQLMNDNNDETVDAEVPEAQSTCTGWNTALFSSCDSSSSSESSDADDENPMPGTIAVFPSSPRPYVEGNDIEMPSASLCTSVSEMLGSTEHDILMRLKKSLTEKSVSAAEISAVAEPVVSGVRLRDVELWSLSGIGDEIDVQTTLNSDIGETIHYALSELNHNITIVEELVDSDEFLSYITETDNVLNISFISSTVSPPPELVSTADNTSDDLSASDSRCRRRQSVVRDIFREFHTANERFTRLRSVLAERRQVDRTSRPYIASRSPIRTRSSGSVPDLPIVQERTIEYKRRVNSESK